MEDTNRKYKKSEIEYLNKLPPEEKKWIELKPFGFWPHKSHELFRRFANLIQILDLPPGAKILDLGMGSGWTSIFLAKFGYKVIGVDISPGMVKLAYKKAKEEKLDIQFRVGDFECSYLFKKDEFDAVLFFDALHHSLDPQKSLDNSYLWLKKSGKILISEPNWMHSLRKETKEIVSKYGLKERGFSPLILKRMLKKSGFKSIVEFYPSPPAYDSSLKNLLKHIFQPLIQRLITKYFRTSLWILARK